jgi:HEAT repeat protein
VIARPKTLAVVHIVLTAALAAPLSAAEEPNEEFIQMIVTLLADTDKEMRGLALEQVRTNVPGEAVTKRLAEELPKLPAPSQAELIRALADRKDAAVRAVILEALESADDEAVRVAAIQALGGLAHDADAQLLVDRLAHSPKVEQDAARASLIRLTGKGAPQAILASMKDASPAVRVALIEILVARRDAGATPDLLTAAMDDEATVRAAAVTALGQLAGPEHIPGMIQLVLKATNGGERQAAEKALVFATSRIADAEKRAAVVFAAMEKLPPTDQIALLPALGRIGGQPALAKIEAMIAESLPQRHDAAVRALCNWPDASVAPRLVKLIKGDEHPDHQVMSLRALIRVAVLPDGRTDDERLELLQQATSLSERDEERRLALERAQAIRTTNTLRFLLPYLDEPALSQQACESVVELAHHRGLREPNKAEFDRALDKVLERTNDPTIRERAQRYKKGQTWARPASAKAPL